jgi:hypothetical protein
MGGQAHLVDRAYPVPAPVAGTVVAVASTGLGRGLMRM